MYRHTYIGFNKFEFLITTETHICILLFYSRGYNHILINRLNNKLEFFVVFQGSNARRGGTALSRKCEKISYVRRGPSPCKGLGGRRHNVRCLRFGPSRLQRSSENQQVRLAEDTEDILQETQLLHQNQTG